MSELEQEKLIRNIKNYFKDQWPTTKWKMVKNKLSDFQMSRIKFESKKGLSLFLVYNETKENCWGCLVQFRSSVDSESSIPLSQKDTATDWEVAVDNAMEQATNILELEIERSLKALKSLLESDHIRQSRRR